MTVVALTFRRGAIVCHGADPNHMLVVRSYPDKTACILVEGERAGKLRLRDFPTRELVLQLESAMPLLPEEKI